MIETEIGNKFWIRNTYYLFTVYTFVYWTEDMRCECVMKSILSWLIWWVSTVRDKNHILWNSFMPKVDNREKCNSLGIQCSR